jgi:formylglycine-generating enzyme required for sulfatase activity
MAALAHRENVFGLALPFLLLAGLSGALAVETGMVRARAAPADTLPETVTLAPAPFSHRPAGAYLQGNVTVSAPRLTTSLGEPLTIMVHEVSAADYARCVAGRACAPAEPAHRAAGEVPVTGVSYDDARAYADWLSARTGQSWRLPTVEEWDFAAGALARDHGLEGLADAADPAQKWLADFDRAAAERVPGGAVPQPLGSIGPNENGLADLGGNVWEWTATCNSRVTLDASGQVAGTLPSCGLRIVEGKHRMPINVFVRDAIRGGCSVGNPPDNLGFRLVRDPPWYARLAARVGLPWR